MPLLWPMVTYRDGKKAFPIQYIRCIQDEMTSESLHITCEFEALVLLQEGRVPEKTDRPDRFCVTFDIRPGQINAAFSFHFEKPQDVVSVEFLSTNEQAVGVNCLSEEIDTQSGLFDTPHGHRDYARRYWTKPEQPDLTFGYCWKIGK